MNWRGRLAAWLVGDDQAANATAPRARVVSGPAAGLGVDFDPSFWQGSASGWSNTYPAMRIGAAYACARLIASSIGSLPLDLYERQADDRRTVARGDRLHGLLHDSPNADQAAGEYVEGLVLDLLFAGDHFARKEENARGDLIALSPINARSVSVVRNDVGGRRYRWSEYGKSYDVGEESVFHIRGFAGDALRGRSVISYGASTLQRANNVETAADTVFSNGVKPSGVFEVGQFLSEEQFEDFNARVADRFAGAENVGRPLILEGGTKFTAIQMSNEDAQLLESRGFSVEEVCRIFGVPPFMVGYTEKSTSWGTGIEQQLMAFQKFTLAPYLRRIEQAISKQLIPAARRSRYFAEFNLEGLLRGDSGARSAFYTAALGDTQKPGWMLRNEVRRKENLPPVEGWDEPIALFQQGGSLENQS